MSKHISLETAAALIPDGAIVSVSSSSGLGCPDLMLKAIGQRFDETGHPQKLTTLHPIAAGDMSGIKGVDYIAKQPAEEDRRWLLSLGTVERRTAADLADDRQRGGRRL